MQITKNNLKLQLIDVQSFQQWFLGLITNKIHHITL
jgi:hypothetical protein